MPCCGQARTQLRATTSAPKTKPAPVIMKTTPNPTSSGSAIVLFKYFGSTGITVTGPASSRVYRFSANGAAVSVDGRDAAALARVPNLRAVRRA